MARNSGRNRNDVDDLYPRANALHADRLAKRNAGGPFVAAFPVPQRRADLVEGASLIRNREKPYPTWTTSRATC